MSGNYSLDEDYSDTSERLPPISSYRVHIPGIDDNLDEDDLNMSQNVYEKYFNSSPISLSGNEREFDSVDAEETIKLFRKPFQILNPGQHVSRRHSEHGNISFLHCRHVLKIGQQYLELRKVLEERARLEFLRDCLFRIKSVSAFVKDLENLVQAEYRTLYGITHNCLTEAPMSKLYCLNGLCEDLRVHVGHWNTIKQRLHTSKWLLPILGCLYIDVEHIRDKLFQLYNNAIYWMEKLIMIGLKVFAHGSYANLTHEILWNITRGLEDFNNILNGLPKARGKTVFVKEIYHKLEKILAPSAALSNLSRHAGISVKAIPFVNVMNILAGERARYAAHQTHRFFTANDEFMRILFSGKLPLYVWNDEVQRRPMSAIPGLDTSDYHTATGSATSISGAVLKVGSVKAPDLSHEPPPLSTFAQNEQTFAEAFLQIVCHSTHILRKSESSKTKHKPGRSSSKAETDRPPKGPDTPVLSRSDSKRKTVSWGDSADSTIKDQLVKKYLDVLWKEFGSALELCFYEHDWGSRERGRDYYSLGSIILCNATLIAIVRSMMENAGLKDLFPPPSVPSLLATARKLHVISALSSWDSCLCEALGNRLSDKCYPCPLASGDYSTRTGMLLRDTYQPLFSILQENLKDLTESGRDSSVLVPKQDLDLCHVTSIISRLLTNCQMSHLWCLQKANSFLSSWAVGNFLLISQTDLKVLADETKKALYQAHTFSGKTISRHKVWEQQMIIYLTEVTKQLADTNEQMQNLSGMSMTLFADNCRKLSKEYFQKSMPLGKGWRKKGTDLPTEHSVYIELALETILEPVVDGVSKLKLSSQLNAMSMAVSAVCEAWKNFILKEKIKFSYLGACQLEKDYFFTRSWLSDSIGNEDVRQTVLDLNVFKCLHGGILLLKKQPIRKSGGRFREPCSMEDLSCPGSNSSGPLERTASSIEYETNQDESDIQYVNNIEEWLALRVQGGSKTWKLPFCLNPPPAE